jgi:vitamin B12 transporter
LTIMHKLLPKTTFLLVVLVFSCSCRVYAQPEREQNTLEMFYEEDDVVVTPSRYPKSISRVAENVTIVTADQIKAINAHTVTDVLNTVTGVQVAAWGGPGSFSDVLIEGSDPRHVLVLIDGVSQNSLSEGKADIGAIPVQNIERIEIVKGPASSAWGSSLGGVVNIITKSPDDTRKIGGIASASIGTKYTGDYRGEVSGRVGSFGYYMNGGGLESEGLLPNDSFHGGNMYTKLKLAATERADLTFTFGYNSGSRGDGEIPAYDLAFDSDFTYLFSTLSLNYLVDNDLFLDLSLRTARRETQNFFDQLSTGIRLNYMTLSATDKEFGGTAKLTWIQKMHQLVGGVDFDLAELESAAVTNGSQRLDKWAIFVNDTLTLGRFSLIPGIRYDYTSSNGDFWSPSLGATCNLAASTILRAYVARGFSIPPLAFTYAIGIGNPDLKVERVWSYAAGFETAALRYLWLKTMFFRNDIKDLVGTDILPDGGVMLVNKEKERRQGVEVEVKTMPVYNLSLLAGYAFVDAKNLVTGEQVTGIASDTVDVGIQYDDRKSFLAVLKGHYIWWHMNPQDKGSYTTMIWDLNLAKKIYSVAETAASLFFTAHNLFNGSQYPVDPFRNPGRWFEGGVRFSF